MPPTYQTLKIQYDEERKRFLKHFQGRSQLREYSEQESVSLALLSYRNIKDHRIGHFISNVVERQGSTCQIHASRTFPSYEPLRAYIVRVDGATAPIMEFVQRAEVPTGHLLNEGVFVVGVGGADVQDVADDSGDDEAVDYFELFGFNEGPSPTDAVQSPTPTHQPAQPFQPEPVFVRLTVGPTYWTMRARQANRPRTRTQTGKLPQKPEAEPTEVETKAARKKATAKKTSTTKKATTAKAPAKTTVAKKAATKKTTTKKSTTAAPKTAKATAAKKATGAAKKTATKKSTTAAPKTAKATAAKKATGAAKKTTTKKAAASSTA
ncbi:hypothetical protein HDV00_003438 [Rhizophlyctis rosea]|nr:hypothetical protein HDV00_003438 [Rhizophlyctis rosea]